MGLPFVASGLHGVPLGEKGLTPKEASYSRVARSRAILNHTRRVKFRKMGRGRTENGDQTDSAGTELFLEQPRLDRFDVLKAIRNEGAHVEIHEGSRHSGDFV